MISRAHALTFAAVGALLRPNFRAAQAERVRVAITLGDAVAEGYYAEKAGFFNRAGLDTQLVMLAKGNLVISLVVGTGADVGIANVGAIAAAHSRQIPFYVIAPGAISAIGAPPVVVVAVMNDSPINNAAQLTGKTVALSALGDLEQAAVMNWIDNTGGDARHVLFVETPHADQLLALRAKRVDAVVLVEPWITSEKKDLRFIGRPYDVLGREIMTHAWIANRGWYESNTAVAQRFTMAIRAAARWCNANPAATASMLEAITKVPRTQILKMNRVRFGETLAANELQPIINVMARYGFIPHGFPASQLFVPSNTM